MSEQSFADMYGSNFFAGYARLTQTRKPWIAAVHANSYGGGTEIALACDMIIAAEDMKFVDHEGFDWEGIQRAMEKNQKKGKAVAGGSTITQQLAKNLFLSGSRSYIRKGEEAIITLMLEAVLDKRRILELYLNVAEWGNGVFGAEAAARHYYGASAASLGPEQAARLAAMLPRPQFYDRNRGSEYLAG